MINDVQEGILILMNLEKSNMFIHTSLIHRFIITNETHHSKA